MKKHVSPMGWLLMLCLVAVPALAQPGDPGGDPDALVPTSGLDLWLRADGTFSVSDGRVVSWQDESGTGRHSSASVVSKRPLFISGALNGLPVVRFEGAQALILATPLSFSNWTLFVVGRNSKPTETFGLILGPGASANQNNQLRYENGTQVLAYGQSNNLPALTTTIGNTRTFHSMSVRYGGSLWSVYRDGVFKSSTSVTTSGAWAFARIGEWTTSCASCYLVGDLAEIIVYNRALSDSERQAVEGYLRGKYALP